MVLPGTDGDHWASDPRDRKKSRSITPTTSGGDPWKKRMAPPGGNVARMASRTRKAPGAVTVTAAAMLPSSGSWTHCSRGTRLPRYSASRRCSPTRTGPGRGGAEISADCCGFSGGSSMPRERSSAPGWARRSCAGATRPRPGLSSPFDTRPSLASNARQTASRTVRMARWSCRISPASSVPWTRAGSAVRRQRTGRPGRTNRASLSATSSPRCLKATRASFKCVRPSR